MDTENSFNIGTVIDNLPVRRFTMLIFFICFLAMLSDGYDLGVVGLAAPGIVSSFHMVRSAMAPVFSAALLGMLVGALTSGIYGDRFGRKRGIIIACFIIGIASFGCGFAPDFTSLLWLRFATGLGLGGLLPNVTAMMAEFLPKKIRAAFTTYAFMGITFGGILPGIVSAQLVGGDWHELFFVGGLIPMIVLPLVFFKLPESLKFLSLDRKNDTEIRKWLGKLAPELAIPQNVTFILNETKAKKFSISFLFADKLKLVTPFLWLVFISIMLVNFFVNSWLAIVLHDIGFTKTQAADTVSLYYVGGVVGGLLIGPALDLIGPIVLALYAAIGCVITTLIGIPDTAPATIHLLVFMIGFSILGAQVGMSSFAGMLYPTAIRSRGAGFAHAIGRIGAISGPLLAGQLIAHHASVFILFLVPVIPLTIAAIGFAVITIIWTGKALGTGLAKMRVLQ
ncbi:MAG: MFS transporter [Acidocella sp.]|nr:MFS transporter [Acidocella sp.]